MRGNIERIYIRFGELTAGRHSFKEFMDNILLAFPDFEIHCVLLTTYIIMINRKQSQ